MQHDASIRTERPGDERAIERVHVAAFGGRLEAGIVAALREVADPYISLVARAGGGVVGHVLFTPVTVRDGSSSFGALGLGPMAVLPERQGRGVGSALVRAGLEACSSASHAVVFVVGAPGFYARFGFRPAPPLGLHYQSPEYDAAFMVAQLKPGALAGRTGTVEYLPPFSEA